MNWLSVDEGWLWTLLYIIVVTVIWPLNVLLISIPFGQFFFFTEYLRRIGTRMRIFKQEQINTPDSVLQSPSPNITVNADVNMSLNNTQPSSPVSSSGFSALQTAGPARRTGIAVFASGAGSNTLKIIDHFRNHSAIFVSLIVCNKPGAGVLAIAEAEKLPMLILEKEKFFRGNGYVDELKSAGVDFIVLAGFLWKIPQILIDTFRTKIINIHPALLPKYGGKGMYGNMVHEAVINAGEKESGITIHYVDEHYDNGDIIFQARVSITDNETPESLAQKIHQLEYSNFPRVIEQLILKPNGS